ncbi:hypothetical protein Nepgr_016352 [Nepenthes gracilis]|uniref:Secreted protein n=1 Tax=Nepenthes gracilis TaxID=150966 RepID=A0AAD3SQC6_NEPGR|nr:hypothetical protein Nepgr_016352 [Nepenthes gracilis]
MVWLFCVCCCAVALSPCCILADLLCCCRAAQLCCSVNSDGHFASTCWSAADSVDGGLAAKEGAVFAALANYTSGAAVLQHQCSKYASTKIPSAQGIPSISLTGNIYHQTMQQQTVAAVNQTAPDFEPNTEASTPNQQFLIKAARNCPREAEDKPYKNAHQDDLFA